MVVSPLNTILNWQYEFEMWQEFTKKEVDVRKLQYLVLGPIYIINFIKNIFLTHVYFCDIYLMFHHKYTSLEKKLFSQDFRWDVTISMLIKTSYTCTNDMHLLNEIDSVSTEIYSPG